MKIKAYIKGRLNLGISGVHVYYELCQIHRTSAVFKTLVLRWQKKFQAGFTNLKDGSRPGQLKTVATNANIAAVASLIKQYAKITVYNIAHSVGLSLGSTNKNLTQEFKLRKVCTRCAPITWQKGYLCENAHSFV